MTFIERDRVKKREGDTTIEVMPVEEDILQEGASTARGKDTFPMLVPNLNVFVQLVKDTDILRKNVFNCHEKGEDELR